MKTVVIHQPDFLPYLGFFHRLLHADLFIYLDHVQFVTNGSRSWTHRDKIKTSSGERWLTVGVKKAPLGTPISAVMLADTPWREQALNLLRENYRNSPYYEEIMQGVGALFELQCERLVEFNVASIKMLKQMLDIKIETCFSSEMHPVGKKNELLVDLLHKVDATHYLSGVGARAYYEAAPFDEAGIQVLWQEFQHPVYQQQFDGFMPYLSTLDMLFNCGIDASRKILRGLNA